MSGRTTAFTKFIFALGFVATLTACGNTQVSLPDDTDNEPAATELPSTSNQDLLATPDLSKVDEGQILQKYDHVDPNHLIQDKHLKAALLYFDANKDKIKNTKYVSVIDFSKSSKEKRFFIIDMSTGSVWAIHVAHGKGSDSNGDGFAEKFSNASGSNASSLGAYLTAETYSGKHGLSLRLDGKSTTNSNARARAVVVHGADYVQESNVIQGRSWGCPAVDMAVRTKLIEMIKGGSLIYAGN